MSSRIHSWVRRNDAATLAVSAGFAALAILFVTLRMGLIPNPFSMLTESPKTWQAADSVPTGSAGPNALRFPSNELGLMTELDPHERSAFTEEIGELHRMLDQVEKSAEVPRNKVDWTAEVDEINSGLDQIEKRAN